MHRIAWDRGIAWITKYVGPLVRTLILVFSFFVNLDLKFTQKRYYRINSTSPARELTLTFWD